MEFVIFDQGKSTNLSDSLTVHHCRNSMTEQKCSPLTSTTSYSKTSQVVQFVDERKWDLYTQFEVK